MEFTIGLRDGHPIPAGTLVKIIGGAAISKPAIGVVFRVPYDTQVGRYIATNSIIENPNGWRYNEISGGLHTSFGYKFPDDLSNEDLASLLNEREC